MAAGTLAVMRKELTVYFTSPIFYLIGLFFLILGGYFFYSNVLYYSLMSFQAAQHPQLAAMLNPNQAVLQPLFSTLAIVFLMMVPVLTMRLLAEEKRSGTAELLFTYPLTDWAVILGKYLAALMVYLVLLLGTLVYPLLLAWVTRLDWGMVAGIYVGMVFFGGACLALGLFTSSFTENQIVAAVAAFVLLLLFWLIGWQQEWGAGGAGGVFAALSLFEHFSGFTRGVIDTRDVLFFLSFSYFFLFLTKGQLESRRWRA